jgi:hypothetical protein
MATTTKPEDRLARFIQRMMKLRLAEIPRLDYDLTFSQMEMLWFIKRAPNRCFNASEWLNVGASSDF